MICNFKARKEAFVGPDRGFSTGRNISFRQNHYVMIQKEYELLMEIPKFGISSH